jgi:hypothetical protein
VNGKFNVCHRWTARDVTTPSRAVVIAFGGEASGSRDNFRAKIFARRQFLADSGRHRHHGTREMKLSSPLGGDRIAGRSCGPCAALATGRDGVGCPRGVRAVRS